MRDAGVKSRCPEPCKLTSMETWKYYGITHSDHEICNPTSSAKLDELVSLLPLRPDARVLDIACGKAELLMRIVTAHGARGVGVDLSPWEVPIARKRVSERGLSESIEIVEGDGAKYAMEPGSYDLAMCIGATWVWGGLEGTLKALAAAVGPGGVVAVGECFRAQTLSPEYVAAEPELAPTLKSHAANVRCARDMGLDFLYALVSCQDDWDRYEHLQTRAAELYAAKHPDDPDVAALLEKRRREDDHFMSMGRDQLGWAIYLLRVRS